MVQEREETRACRREEVLAALEACAQLLKERFGARRVIPFGSVMAPERWHDGSDIDLAVEGLDPRLFWQAWVSLEDVVPPGLSVVVSLETAAPELHTRILGGGLVGVERRFERLAVGLEEGLPQSGYWPGDLRNQMADAQTGRRPAVIDEPVRARLREDLRFRPCFRHAYGCDMEWGMLRPLVEGMGRVLAALREQIETFLQTVEDLRRDAEWVLLPGGEASAGSPIGFCR